MFDSRAENGIFHALPSDKIHRPLENPLQAERKGHETIGDARGIGERTLRPRAKALEATHRALRFGCYR